MAAHVAYARQLYPEAEVATALEELLAGIKALAPQALTQKVRLTLEQYSALLPRERWAAEAGFVRVRYILPTIFAPPSQPLPPSQPRDARGPHHEARETYHTCHPPRGCNGPRSRRLQLNLPVAPLQQQGALQQAALPPTSPPQSPHPPQAPPSQQPAPQPTPRRPQQVQHP